MSNPTLAVDLTEFLGRAACEARLGRGPVIDVRLPHATTREQARLYLDLYLAAWAGLHPSVHLEVVDGPASRWPW